MAYIHTKRIGDKNYYTLRISVREKGNVITRDLCNLGTDLSKIKIDQLEKKYKREIRKSYRTIKKFLETDYYLKKAKKVKLKKTEYFTKEQLENIEAIKLHFNSKFLKLDLLTQKEMYNGFLIQFAVNSTAIEGNTITLKEAQKLFKEEITPKNRTLKEVYDLTNTKKVVNYLMNEKPKLTLKLIVMVHDKLLENIDERIGFRTHDIHILGQPFKPSPARYVKADLELMLKWYNSNKKRIHPLALVTFFHHKFESIHPFSDGNGRTGRVIMNYILSSFNHPPMVISNRFRNRYLEAMNIADKAFKTRLTVTNLKDYRDLLNFIYTQFKFSYWDNFLV